MKRILPTLAVLALSASLTFPGELLNIDRAVGHALDGYDPVAFFTDKKPVKGDFKITATHKGATYFFASRKNRDTFQTNPDRYAPAYGGYCAVGAALGVLLPVDISTWQVVNDHLVLNYSADVQKMFNKDQQGTRKKGDANWPKLVAEHAK
ncbi:MAG: YHS domain-containing protein [Verrucomicrobiales bacterium]|nr:YHS domain-containing protein [Verrucomicrobiales bacterium]